MVLTCFAIGRFRLIAAICWIGRPEDGTRHMA